MGRNLRAIAWVFGVSTYPGAIRHSVVSGLATRSIGIYTTLKG
ncbi:hypothetical protein FIV41_17385 [Pseudomonas marginalis]|uniref:Uncharacterized protein n=1 Tax=Pseudomonas marginalis TaxID=298 RepID=A0A9X9BQY2_PSEMA|nr:hypothetical protein FIV41_17385 [Pseudomonas marginalis]